MQVFDGVVRILPVALLVGVGVCTLGAVFCALMNRQFLREEARADERANLSMATEDYMKWLGRAAAASGVFILAVVLVYVVMPLEDEALRLTLLIAAVAGAWGMVALGARLGAFSGERAIRAARSAARRAQARTEG